MAIILMTNNNEILKEAFTRPRKMIQASTRKKEQSGNIDIVELKKATNTMELDLSLKQQRFLRTLSSWVCVLGFSMNLLFY